MFRTELVEKYQVVGQVWGKILKRHPEVTKLLVKEYAKRPHGFPGDQTVMVLPRERVEWDLPDTPSWKRNSIYAMGAVVEVRPREYDPRLDYTEIGRYTDGDFLDIHPDRKRSLVFIDFESPPSEVTLDLCLRTLREWKCDWFLLDSGGSYHLIFDMLLDPWWAVGYHYGQFLEDLGDEIPTKRGRLYRLMGTYLKQNWHDHREIAKWTESVLSNFGHVDERVGEKMVAPVDMRYLAHVLGGFYSDSSDEGFLRVSQKYGSAPILKAKRENRTVVVYQSNKDPFDRPQLRLPGI